jgi:hypothetical protein
MTAPDSSLALAQRFLSALFSDSGELPDVDWERFRVMQLIQGTAGADAADRERLVGRGLVELARAPLTDETRRRAASSLRALFEVILPRGWRVVSGYVNPMVARLALGPQAGAPPNVTRFLQLLAEIARDAAAVTVCARDDDEGHKLVTLLFVDGRYVGFLPGTQLSPS